MAASQRELEAALRALSNVEAHTQSLEDMFLLTSDRALRPKHDLETALRALDAIGKRADEIDESIGRASASVTPLLTYDPAPEEEALQQQPPELALRLDVAELGRAAEQRLGARHVGGASRIRAARGVVALDRGGPEGARGRGRWQQLP